jgi:hypothetical protein
MTDRSHSNDFAALLANRKNFHCNCGHETEEKRLHLDLILLVILFGLAVWTEVDKLRRRHTIAGDEKQTQHGTFQ